jgi:hypothetical protein
MSQIIVLELKKPTTKIMSLDITEQRIRDLENKKNQTNAYKQIKT